MKKFISIFLTLVVFISIAIVPSNVFAADPTEIQEINFKNFKYPEIGKTVSSCIPSKEDIEILDPAGFDNTVIKSVDVSWCEYLTQKPYSESDKFVSSMVEMDLTITLDEGDAVWGSNFGSGTTFVKVNGEYADEDDNIYYVIDSLNSVKELDLVFVFDLREGTYNVDDIELEFLPTVGSKINDAEVTGNTGIYASLFFEDPITGDYYLEDDDVFEAGKKYNICIFVECLNSKFITKNGEKIDDEGFEVIINFNGKPLKANLFRGFEDDYLLDIEILGFEPFDNFNVTFDANGHGTAPEKQVIIPGNYVTKPEDLKAEGYTFGGWFTDKECTKEFNFDKKIYEDTTLYAKWTKNSTTPATGDNLSTFIMLGGIAAVGAIAVVGINKKEKNQNI